MLEMVITYEIECVMCGCTIKTQGHGAKREFEKRIQEESWTFTGHDGEGLCSDECRKEYKKWVEEDSLK